MLKVSLFLLCISSFLVSFNEAVNYRGYKVLSVTPETKEHAEFLYKLREHYSVDLWKEPYHLGIPVLLHAKPELSQPLQKTLKELNIRHSIVHHDLQSLIDHEKVANTPLSESSSEAFNFAIYNQYEEILLLIAELTTKYPKLAKSEIIGKSYENRPIHSLKITSGDALNKTAIIIECGIHAREWTSVAACAYLVDQLIEKYGSDSTETNLLDKYEFNVVLVSNPDGYVYTWTKDRMWRKSRSKSSDDWLGVCRGVDINRNFDYDHCGIGSSNNPCEFNYCGEEPFSEGEARALRDLMISKKGRTKAYISIHTYSQLWMTPYGDKKDFPPNYEELERVAKVGIEALRKSYNTEYKFGPIISTLYPVTGSSIDYAYVKQNVKYSYTLELRDTGTYGHFLPKELILPTCIETYEGLLAAINAM